LANTITVTNYSTDVRNRLGDTSFDSAMLIQFANDTNKEICNFADWPFKETSFQGTVDGTSAIYDFQPDCESLINLILVDPNSNATFLRYLPYKEFDLLYPDPTALTPASPTIWTTFGSTFQIGPATPDQTYTLLQRYIKNPTEITTGSNTIDIPDSFSEVFTLGMLRRAQAANDQYDLSQITSQEFDLQIARMKQRLIKRQTGELARMGRLNKRPDWLAW
jgi:hypothetical protein